MRSKATIDRLGETVGRCEETVDQTRSVLAERSAERLRQRQREQARQARTAWEAVTLFASLLRLMPADGAWSNGSPITYQHLTVHPQRQAVESAGRTHLLTRTEWQLFTAFLSRPGEVLSRGQLAVLAWGAGPVDRSTEVEVYISRLRRKVELDPHRPRLIETIRGSGYRLTARAAERPARAV